MRDEISLYTSNNGICYALQFLKELKAYNNNLWIKLNAHLEVIKDPTRRRRPFSFPLQNGLFEVRVRYDTLQGRMNYCFDKGILLLNGYIKNDRKSMEKGIALGRKLLKEIEGEKLK